MDNEYEKEVLGEGIDLEEISRKYEVRGFFRRLGDMFKGLGRPHDTREYKLARIELQRLAAPLVAIVVPVLFGVVLCVVTMVSGREWRDNITVDIPPIDDDPVDITEDPIPPPDIDPPVEDPVIDVAVDIPTPGPVTPPNMPLTANPAQPLTTKPATVDTVAMVKSPVSLKQLTGGRNTGTIGRTTGGGDKWGDPTTEITVMKVLWWLKAHQNTDGSWGGGNKIANTALAILTYLAHGEFPGSDSPYRRDFGPVVQQAVDYLVGNMTVGGDNVPRFRGSDGNEYSFLLATYALCETYGMTRNPNCKEAAERCLSRIVQNQSSTGGWDYKLNRNSTRDDLSYAGWAIQALKAGKMAGLHPDGLQVAINKAINCLKKRSYSKSGGFTYTPTSSNNGGSTGLAGVGTLAMQLLGRGSESEALNALEVMRDWKPSFDPEQMSAKKPGSSPQYYCYYATQCKYQAGMKAGATKNDEVSWQQWNVAMKKLYPSLIKDLPEKVADYTGREHRQGYFENHDAHSTRPYMDTCLAALQLMVYYRYLPTTSVDAGKDDSDANVAKAMDKSKDVAVIVDI